LNYSNLLKNILSQECSIIGKERFLNSAVLIPIISLNNQDYILFEKRSASVRQPGEVSFPGGHFDPLLDDSFLNTAIRETCEELGVKPESVDVIGKLGTLVTPMEIIVEAFVGVIRINDLSAIKIDTKEVDKIFLVPLKYFIENNPSEYNTRLELHPFDILENGERKELLPVKELGLPEKYSESWTKGKHRVLVYRTNNEIIWGITAELIYELSNKIRNYA
jgi:8-oxo-dGTP pyrophosphatase MutT (NUDIX family)